MVDLPGATRDPAKEWEAGFEAGRQAALDESLTSLHAKMDTVLAIYKQYEPLLKMASKFNPRRSR